jgi:hypothetical protein
MGVLKGMASFAIGALVLVVTLYFVISLFVAYFKVTGVIAEGQKIYFDLMTPTWPAILAFQAGCVAILWGGFFLRRKLRAHGER